MPRLTCARAALASVALLLLTATGCTTVDPGPNYVVPNATFDPDYFYCHVEPQLVFGKKCGSGDPSQGDAANGCHFNSSAVSGMALVDHAPVDCGGGDHPVDRTQVGTGGPAEGNLQSVSLEMSRDYLTAPVYVRPTNNAHHPRQIFTTDDPVVAVIRSWATR